MSGLSVITKKPFLIAASNAPSKIKSWADYVCTGTNDEVTIQRAIDKIYEHDGGDLVLSDGLFEMSSHVSLISNLRLMASPATTVKMVANAGNDVDMIKATTQTNIEIVGGLYDGNKSAQTTVTGMNIILDFVDCSDITVRDLDVKDSGTSDAISGYNIYFKNSTFCKVLGVTSTGAKRENCVFYSDANYGIVEACHMSDSEDRNLVVHAASHISVNNCVFKASQYSNVDIQQAGVEVSDYVKITNCDISDSVDGYGVQVGNDCKGTLITGCTITGNNDGGVFVNSSGVSVRNNEISFNGIMGVKVDANCSHTSITGNTFEGNGNATNVSWSVGIFLWGVSGGQVSDVLITGNTFLPGTYQTGYLRMLWSDYVLVTGNHYRNNNTLNDDGNGIGNVFANNL